ncbi:xylan 1,4-beta-xylosidase [Paraclostridium sordellii 8483]|nr:xylan 1,4-beta-xylosidase [Paeniclostridium sordellii 8483]
MQSFGFSGIKIIVDQDTGVNYLVYCVGQGVGLTPLLDSKGNVVISPVNK